MSTELLDNYPKYDSYKDSSVDWLGEIPSHWQVWNSKWLFASRKEKAQENDEQLTASQKYGVIPQKLFMDLEGRKVTTVFLNHEILKHVKKGDFVISMRSFQGGIEYCDYQGSVSSAYVPLIPNDTIYNSFYKFLLKSKRYIEALQSTSNLVRDGQALRYDNFCMVPLVLIPLKEQKAIADFLDTKTSQIDQAIELKQQQIERLNEYKQIVIQNAVTKGLDPNVPMKNSGTDWIGDVPDHWEVKAIKRISRVARGASPRPIDDPRYFDDEGEYAWVRIKDVTASNRYLTETTQSLSKLGSLLSVRMQPDEIFLSIAGSVGKPIITKIKACIHDGFVYFPDWNQSEEFLYYIFLSGQPYLGLGKIGTQLNLNSETVGSIKIGLPPIDEQKRIVEYLDIETNKANELIEFQKNQIERLKEYKTILINQAVTGKIKVS